MRGPKRSAASAEAARSGALPDARVLRSGIEQGVRSDEIRGATWAHMVKRSRRKEERSIAPNPMEEANFPEDSPTRRAVEREMREPANVRPSGSPLPRQRPPIQEIDEGP